MYLKLLDMKIGGEIIPDFKFKKLRSIDDP